MPIQKLIKSILPLIIFTVVTCPITGYGSTVGPYSGLILDGETGQPVEGATVLMYWTKLIHNPNQSALDPRLLLLAQKEGVDAELLMLTRAEDTDAKLIFTDNKGKYNVPKVSINTGGSGKLESYHLIIYQPGYQVHIITKHLIDSSQSPQTEEDRYIDYIVKLQRIPAKFDHEKHYDTIQNALRDMNRLQYDQKSLSSWDKLLEKKLKTNPEKAILLRRAEWEQGHYEDDSRTYFSDTSNSTQYVHQWMELLKAGSSREKQIALENLTFLQNPANRKDLRVFDPIVGALKDKDPLVREATVAFLKDLGSRTHGCCLETEIVPALQKSLGDASAAVRAEVAKVLGYYRDKRSVAALMSGLNDPNVWVRLNAVNSLGLLGKRNARKTKIRDDESKLIYLLRSDQFRGREDMDRAVGTVVDVSTKFSSETIVKNGREVRMITAYQPPIPVRYDRLPQFKHHFKLTGVDVGADDAIPPIIALLKDKSNWLNVFVRSACVRAIGTMRVQDKLPSKALLQLSDDNYLKLDIIDALGKMGSLDSEDMLIRALSDDDKKIRQHALKALKALLNLPIEWSVREDQKIESYHAQLKKQYCEERLFSVYALSNIGGKETMEPLLDALKDSCDLVIGETLDALQNYYDPTILPGLVDLFENTDATVRKKAVRAFNNIAAGSLPSFVKVFRGSGKKFIVKTKIGEDEYQQVDKRHLYNAVVPEGILNGKFVITSHFEHTPTVTRLIAALSTNNAVMQENALSVITQFEDNRIEPSLVKLIDDPSIAKSAITALENYGTSMTVSRLVKMLQNHEQSLSTSVFQTLASIGDKMASEAVRAYLNDKDQMIRAAAMKCLEKLGDIDIYKTALAALIERTSVPEMLSAIELFGKKKDSRAVEPLIAIVEDGNVYVAPEAVRLLGNIGDRRAVEPLTKKLIYIESLGQNYHDNGIKYKIIIALKKIGDSRAVPVLIQMLKSDSPGVISESITALQEFKDSRAVPALIAVSDRRINTWSFVQSSTIALGKIGSPVALDHLEKLLYKYAKEDKTGWTRTDIIRAIGGIEDDKTINILMRYVDSSEIPQRDMWAVLDVILKRQRSAETIRYLVRVSGKKGRNYCDSLASKIISFSDPTDIIEVLIVSLATENNAFKVGGIKVLGYIYMHNRTKDQRILASLKSLLSDNDPWIRSETEEEMKLIEASLSPKKR